LFSPLNVLIRQNLPIVNSSVFVPSLHKLDFTCMNRHVMWEHNDRCINFTRSYQNKLIVIRVICFPVLSTKGYKKPQQLQGSKYMPHLSIADIRISLLFKKNSIFCLGTTDSLLWAVKFPVRWNWVTRAIPFVFTF